MHRLVAQRSDRGIACLEGGRVAECAPDTVKQAATSGNRLGSPWGIRRRRRWREETHEEGELFDGAEPAEQRWAIDFGDAVGNGRKLARRDLIPLRLKGLVGDAHFHIVCFPGEDQEGFVLSLPSKTAECAVIAVLVRLARDRVEGQDDIGPAANAEICLGRGVTGVVREDLIVCY